MMTQTTTIQRSPKEYPMDKNIELPILLEENKDCLLGFIKRNMSTQLAQKVEAYDILQDTMISAMKNFDRTDFCQIRPYPWLCHLAEQRIIDCHRHFFAAKKRSALKEIAIDAPLSESMPEGLMGWLATSMTTPTQAIQNDEHFANIDALLNTLSDEQRSVLQLRYVDGLEIIQISQQIGKTCGALRVMLSRTMALIRHEIYAEELV